MGTKVKCLLVDDLAENLLALNALLRSDEVELLQARSGAEALELLLAHDVALALIDVQMPEMDGFELAELMRGSERTRHVPIIFVTAGIQSQHRVFKGYDLGAVDFLHKPLEPHVLRNKASVFFQLSRQRTQLAAQLAELTETLRLNEMFTAVLGHDLRNPLGAIMLAGQILSMQSTEPAVRTTAARIQSSGKRMERMITDMLDLARTRLGGGIPLNRAPVDLGRVVERMVLEHRDDALPDGGGRIAVSAEGSLAGDWDEDRLCQVVSNLLGNALQHGGGDGVAVQLDGRDSASVKLSVSNSGEIAAPLLPLLFNPFQGSRQTGAGAGLGLGLYIVERIVAGHGGSVAVETARGRTTFRVELPRRGGLAPAVLSMR